MFPHIFPQNITDTPSLITPFQSLNILPLQPHPLNLSMVDYQTLLLQANTLKLLQVRNMYLQDSFLLPKVKLQRDIIMENSVRNLASINLSNTTTNSIIENHQFQNKNLDYPSFKTQNTLVETTDPNISLKNELKKMLKFILTNVNKISQAEIEKARSVYFQNPVLLQVYDKLIIKYFSTKKCKEDIVRYILRKAFKMMRTAIINKEKIVGKKASFVLCKRYFSSRFEEMEKAGVNLENEDELLEFIMPYKKNSKNRTMNTNFIEEIFSSNEFSEEYQKFLKNFDKYLTEDNYKKSEKLINLILDCVKKNEFSRLTSFTRLPWLNSWVEDTKNIAIGLIPSKALLESNKKQKI